MSVPPHRFDTRKNRYIQEGYKQPSPITLELKQTDLVSQKRTKELVQPRQIAMYMCRELTQMSYSNIAQAFNRENHTTVIHACKQVEKVSRSKTMKNDKWLPCYSINSVN